MRLKEGDEQSARMARSDFETLFAAQMTGIYSNNGRLRVNLSFAEKCQFRNKMPFSQPFRNAFCSCEMNVTMLRSGYENGFLLRNWLFSAKLKLTLSLPLFLYIPVI